MTCGASDNVNQIDLEMKPEKLILFMNPFRVFLLVCFVLHVMIMSVKAQSKDVTEVLNAVEKLRNAILYADRNRLDSLTSHTLSYGHSSGHIENKEEFISSLQNKKYRFITLEFKDLETTISDDVAVVRHTLSGNILDEGKPPGKAELSVLLVWQKQKTEWKLLTRQAVRI